MSTGSPNTRLSTATPKTIRQDLRDAVHHLLGQIAAGREVCDEVLAVRQLLESLPLATAEFDLAVARLRNAHRYLVSRESGAARYELQMLAGSLRVDRANRISRRRA